MRIYNKVIAKSKKQKIGKMIIEGVNFYVLLPNYEWIPTNTPILCKKYIAPTYGKTFELIIPGHSAVLFHNGNTFHDTRGCQILGFGLGDVNGDGIRDVTSSRKAFQKFLEIMKDVESFYYFIEE